jgi:hypothetical protein
MGENSILDLLLELPHDVDQYVGDLSWPDRILDLGIV